MKYIKEYTLGTNGELTLFIDGVEYNTFFNVDSVFEAKLLIQEENNKLMREHFGKGNKKYWVLQIMNMINAYTTEHLITEAELMECDMETLLNMHTALHGLSNLMDMVKLRNASFDILKTNLN